MKRVKGLLVILFCLGLFLFQKNEVKAQTGNSPQISLIGESTIVLQIGVSYEEYGAKAIDVEDGDLTSQIVQTGIVDSTIKGQYEITYTVKDSDENQTTIKRTILVIDYTEWELKDRNIILRDIRVLDNGDFIGVGNCIIRISSFGEVIWLFASPHLDFYKIDTTVKSSIHMYEAIGLEAVYFFNENGKIYDINNYYYNLNSFSVRYNEKIIDYNINDLVITDVVSDQDGFTILARVHADYNSAKTNKYPLNHIEFLGNQYTTQSSFISIVIHLNNDHKVFINYFYGVIYYMTPTSNGIHLILSQGLSKDNYVYVHLSYTGSVINKMVLSEDIGDIYNFYSVNDSFYIIYKLNRMLNTTHLILSQYDHEFNKVKQVTLFDYNVDVRSVKPLEDGNMVVLTMRSVYKFNPDGILLNFWNFNEEFVDVFQLKDGFLLQTLGYKKLIKMNEYLEYDGVKIKTSNKEISYHDALELNSLTTISSSDVNRINVIGDVKDEVGYYKIIFEDVLTNKDVRIRTQDLLIISPLIRGVSDGIFHEAITPQIDGGYAMIKPYGSVNARIDDPDYYKITIIGNNGYSRLIVFYLQPSVKGLIGKRDLVDYRIQKQPRVYRHSVTPDISLGDLTLNGKPFNSGTTISKNGTYHLEIKNYYTYYFVIEKPNSTLLFVSIGLFLGAIGGGISYFRYYHKKGIV